MGFTLGKGEVSGKRILIGLVVLCTLFIAGVYAYISSMAFMSYAASKAGAIATETLNTRIDVGLVEVDSFNSIRIKDISVYDKQNKLIASSQDTVVGFSALTMLKQSPVDGIKDITLTGVKGNVFKRDDGTWNFEDLISQEPSQNKFTAKIHVKDGELNAVYDGQEIKLSRLDAMLDFDNYPTTNSVRLEGSAENDGARVKLKANIGGDRQTFDVEAEDIYIENYLRFVPAGTIPENKIRDISGHVKRLMASGEKVGQDLYYTGQLELDNGKATILDKNIDDISGMVVANERFAQVFARARAYGQEASAHGKITLDTGTPVLNLTAEIKDFDPSKIYEDTPYSGTVSATMNITGAANNPTVDGTVSIKSGSVSGYDFSNVSAKLHYADSVLMIKDLSANLFGGTVTGEVEFSAADYSYVGHLKGNRIDAGTAISGMENAPAVGGVVSCDIAVYGQGTSFDVNNLQAVGSVSANDVNYDGLELQSIDASLAKNGKNIKLDYAMLKLANGGTVGIDGSIVLDESIDCGIYASNFDLSLLKPVLKDVDISGFADLEGTVKGPIDNPTVRADYAARSGSIYYQPYDRLHGKAAGSLRGVKIDDFVMEHGDTKWYINNGMVGFKGDMGINMRIDTVGARMEDLIKTISLDQDITGNVDNVITITGTLKNPNIVGYVHFYQGSFEGVFLTGMDGDYKIKDRAIELQDFHVYSPWLDVDLNGTIDKNENINLKVAAHEFSIDRYSDKLGYPIGGKAKFDGTASGTMDKPLFEGQLVANGITLNGVSVSDVNGRVRYKDYTMFVDNMGFSQNGGDYRVNASLNMDTHGLGGNITIKNADINGLIKMADFKDNRIGGRINGVISLGGTVSHPHITCDANITKGNFGIYPFKDVVVRGDYNDRRITIQDISGSEGQDGKLKINGLIDLDGKLDATASMTGVDVGAITESVGIKLKTSGKINLLVQAKGTTQNPEVDASLEATNVGIENNALDSITGLVKLRNKVINVEQWVAAKKVNNKDYRLSGSGTMPLEAFTADKVKDDNQFNMLISLDKADMSLLPYLWKEIDWAIGSTSGQLRITGIAKKPFVNGSFGLDEGAFKLKSLANPITDVNAKIVFKDNMATIERFGGQIGKGKFNATAYVGLDGITPVDYKMNFSADKLDINCSFYKGPLTATLNIEDTVYNGRNIPKVSGRVFLDDCTLSIPSIPSSDSELPEVMMDYDIELGNSVRFISPMVGDMRLGGNAHFGGTTLEPASSGSIYVKKGKISYLKTSLQILTGEVKFDVPGSLYPRLILQATTKINKTRVFVSLDGPLTNMRFRLRSIPAMSESDIIMLLTLRSNYNSKNSDSQYLTSMMNLGLQMTLLGEVETAMRNFLNLDEFTVERDTTDKNSEKTGDKKPEEVYNIKMGKSISDKMMIKYQRSMTNNDYKYGLDYDFNDRIGMGLRMDQDKDFLASIEARFTF